MVYIVLLLLEANRIKIILCRLYYYYYYCLAFYCTYRRPLLPRRAAAAAATKHRYNRHYYFARLSGFHRTRSYTNIILYSILGSIHYYTIFCYTRTMSNY